MFVFINGGGRIDKDKKKNNFLAFYSKFIKNNSELVVFGDDNFTRSNRAEFEKYFKERTKLRFINPASKLFYDKNRILGILERCGGIYIAGGNTLNYYKYYVNNQIKNAIQNAFLKGIPIAGSSAGAILLSSSCCVVGGYTIKGSKKYRLGADTPEMNDVHNNRKVSIKNGFNIIKDKTIDVHLTSYGRLPRLIEVVKKTKLQGVGIDENTFLLYNGKCYKVFGEGRVFVVNSYKSRVNISIYKEGDYFS